MDDHMDISPSPSHSQLPITEPRHIGMKLTVRPPPPVSHLSSHEGVTIFPLVTLTSPCGRLTLTPLTGADLPALYSITHPPVPPPSESHSTQPAPNDQPDPSTHPYFGGMTYGPFATLADYTHYCQLTFFSRPEAIAFVVRTRHSPDGASTEVPSDQPPSIAGVLALHYADPAHLRVGGHVWYTERFRSGFVSNAALATLLKWVFEDLGFRRAEWKCISTNRASFKAALALGFVYEGRARAFLVGREPQRERVDMDNFGMTDLDWFGKNGAEDGQEQARRMGGVRQKMWKKLGLL